jgi:hypothetical protein
MIVPSFYFNINGEPLKRDVKLNGNESLGHVQNNNPFYNLAPYINQE